MSEYNPIKVEKEILETVNQISHGIIVARDAHERFLEAERAFKKAYARAYMTHKGPQTEKKIAAGLVPEVEAAEIARDAAEVAYRYARDTNNTLSEKLDALRSVGAGVRQAYANAGRGEW